MSTTTARWTEEDAAGLAQLEAEFEAAGGRGVDLAEEIDWLRAKRDNDSYGSEDLLRDMFDSSVQEPYGVAEFGEPVACQDGHAAAVVIPGGRKFIVHVKEADA